MAEMNVTSVNEITWGLEFHKTVESANGKRVDMWWLSAAFDCPNGEGGTYKDAISIGVPHGRNDIAEFIAQSVMVRAEALEIFRKART